jgi:hypothetical protein
MKGSKEILLAALAFAIAGTVSFAADQSPATGLGAFRVEGDRVISTVQAGPYRVLEDGSWQRIEMEGYGHLNAAGRPMLPTRRYLIALPPGARALSVELLGITTERVPGTYRITPALSPRLLGGIPRYEEASDRLRAEFEAAHDEVYLADDPFPEERVRLAGMGTLRKYSYAAVDFCPFTYHPLSGRLDYHGEVEFSVTLEYPEPDGAEAALVERLMLDNAADDRAERVFCNYAGISGLYQLEEPQAVPLTSTYDYVIITTGDLVGAVTASSFPAWKTSLGHNLRTVLTTDSEIASMPGGDLAKKIRNFLRQYYATWGIEYVLMVGDYATVPMRICYPDPDYHVYDPWDVGLVACGTPTDYYYADLSYHDDISWDSDGDGYMGEYGQDNPDFMAEVSVGRIPVNDSTRITYTLDKLVTFEQDTGAWKENVLHAGTILFFENQDHGGYPLIDGASCLDSIETALMGGMTITHMTEQEGLVTSLFPWPPVSEAAFTSAWGSGEHAVVNWSGHGWSDGAYRTVWVWDDGDGVPESGERTSYRFIGTGAANLDDDHPSIVFAISCNVGFPEPNPYGNLGIDLLTLPGWGTSAGVLSSSRPAAVAGDWKTTGGGTEQICYDFNRYMLVEGEKVGDALYDGKFHATTYYGWDHIYEYMDLYNYNLYGDPALAVSGATAGISGGHGRYQLLELAPAEPNPFTSATTLRFMLSEPERVTIKVYDIRGRAVSTLADRVCSAGGHTVTWSGTGPDGSRVAPGIYLVAARAGSQTETRKLVLR